MDLIFSTHNCCPVQIDGKLYCFFIGFSKWLRNWYQFVGKLDTKFTDAKTVFFFYLSQLSSWMTVTPNQRHQKNFPGSMGLLKSPLHSIFPFFCRKRRHALQQNGRICTCVPTCWTLFLAWKPHKNHREQTSLHLAVCCFCQPQKSWGASQVDWYSQDIQYKLHAFIIIHSSP